MTKTNEEKKLLIKDLCGRLPYGVIVKCCDTHGETLIGLTSEGLVNFDYDIDEVKPMLYPLSSMTKEQKKEYDKIVHYNVNLFPDQPETVIDVDLFEVLEEFYNKNHLDFRGLISMGLAEDCTNLNIYKNENM